MTRQTSAEIRASDAYRALVERGGLDLSVQRVACIVPEGDHLGSEPEERLLIRRGEALEFPGHGTVAFVDVDRIGRPVLEMPAGLRWWGFWSEPTIRLALPPAPRGREDYAARCAAIKAETGVRAFGVCAGWIPLFGAAAKAVALALGPAAVKRVMHKEKFGTLQVNLDVSGDAAAVVYASDVATWAECASFGVCAAFGTPGRLVWVDGWALMLSPEAMALPREELNAAIYPF